MSQWLEGEEGQTGGTMTYEQIRIGNTRGCASAGRPPGSTPICLRRSVTLLLVKDSDGGTYGGHSGTELDRFWTWLR